MRDKQTEAFLGVLSVALLVLVILFLIVSIQAENAQQKDCEKNQLGRYISFEGANPAVCVNELGKVIKEYE